MNPADDIKTMSRAQLVLLGIFAMSLIAAKLIIATKIQVVLSEPILVPGTNLYVRMPAGQNWMVNNNWQLEGYNVVLSGYFLTRSQKPDIHVTCRYFLQTRKSEAKRTAERAALYNGRIVQEGRLVSAALVIKWAHFKKTGGISMFYGTMQLPNGRSFDMEVAQTTGDVALAKKVFFAVIGNIQYRSRRMSRKLFDFDDKIFYRADIIVN